MNAVTFDKLQAIKQSVAAMMEERESEDIKLVFRVNQLWRNLDRFMEYVRHLPPEQLETIRAHTTGMGFFAGNTYAWQKDFHDGHRISSDAEAIRHPLIERYLNHTDGLPEDFHCSEPGTNDLVGQIGIRYRDRIINHDIVKEQACIANLYNVGILPPLHGKRWVIVEVGSGYGQLAHQLSRGLGKSGCYICVDYPETLFWSSTFLCLNNAPDSIYVYDPAATEKLDIAELTTRYQFIMLPNYLSDRLKELKTLDLVVNQNSMQEMTEEQVRYYLELFSKIMTGWIYSYNSNRQFMNLELKTPIFELLRNYFKGWPASSFYEKLYGDTWHLTDQKYLFLGHRKGNAAPKRSPGASGAVWISGRRAVIDFC
jgi:hypothetical protein